MHFSTLSRIGRLLLDALVPRHCAGCERGIWAEPNPAFCRGCWEQIPWFADGGCPGCAIPFASPHARSHSPTHRCGRCRRRPRRFDGATAAGPYEGALAKAIHLFKYHRGRNLAEPLAEALVPWLAPLPAPDWLVPVPLNVARLRQREYNQSLLLADAIARRLGYRVAATALQRPRDTPSQALLSERDRRRNIRGAFRLARAPGVEGRAVWLIDDVLTTGATAEECARVLKRSGAAAVHLVAVARALRAPAGGTA